MPISSDTNHHNIRFVNLNEQRIVSSEMVEEIGIQLGEIAADLQEKKVIIDLTGVESMTSMMLGQLVKFQKALRDRKVEVGLCCLAPDIASLLQVSKLDSLFQIFETREMAMYGFK